MPSEDGDEVTRLPPRVVPPPTQVSAAARAALLAVRAPTDDWPDPADLAAWTRLAEARDVANAAASSAFANRLQADVTAISVAQIPIYIATPRDGRLLDQRHIVLDIHGGALLFGRGEANVRFEAAAMSLRTGRITYALDYRVPPENPFPAALDDCMAAYRALLAERSPETIVVMGTSAGGNLAAALLLRARDEGLPMPAGAILLTPELDLTESGDTFNTLMGLDVVLQRRLMPANLVYAAGADLTHPYLSPLFGDVSGFPPTLIQAGLRDIFLSNAALMHRKLRRSGVRAELHAWEGMPHGGFGGLTPEDREVSAELQAFIASL